MIIARFNRWIRLARDEEDGLTLIEVLVASIVLALAAMATFGVLAAATRNAQRAQALQVALDKAQEEMEKLHTLSYDQLALTGNLPQHVNDPLHPNYRVRNDDGTYAVERDPLGRYAEMVRNGGELWGSKDVIAGGVVDWGPIPFQEGSVSGKIYRYIVWRNDPECPQSEVGAEDFCPGDQDYKQLIVAVKLDTPGNETRERNYVEVQSQVSNPKMTARRSTREGGEVGEGGTGGETEEEKKEREEKEAAEEQPGGLGTGKAITAQQFFLSDTPCDPDGETSREAIVGDHLLHNTLGTCASGLRNGQSKNGAPDALLLGPPPDPDPIDEFNPLLYDYSSDSYLEPTPDTDKGVQILRDDSAGCNYVPKSSVHPEAKVHRWVTDPMPREFKMSGTVTLEFYSRTLNDASYPGTICAFLFIRSETGSGEETEATDTLLENDDGTGRLYWTYSSQGTGSWPRTEWTKLRLEMNIAGTLPLTIHEDERLGVALTVDAGNTPADAIPVMYDHPNYPTRLEVDTTTPFEGN